MKVFIIFLGLFIINVSFLSYQGDMGRYVRSQAFLKALAEECASGASLYYDEDAYSGGQFQFQYEEGQKYIEYIIKESKNQMPLPAGSTISYEVKFEDDVLGYENGEAYGALNNPSVRVVITAATEDLFRLPFLEVTRMERAAKYELPQ